MAEPIMQASIAIEADLSPLREGLRSIKDEINNLPEQNVRVGVESSPIQNAIAAVAQRVPPMPIGDLMARSMDQMTPVLNRISAELRPIAEMAREFTTQIYAKELKSRIESTNNTMLKGLYQGLQVANDLNRRMNFMAGMRSQVGAIFSRFGVGGARHGSFEDGDRGASGRGFNFSYTGGTRTAPLVALSVAQQVASGGGMAGAAAGGAQALATMLPGRMLGNLAVGGLGAIGVGALGLGLARETAARGGFGSLSAAGGPLEGLMESAKTLDATFATLGEKLLQPFLKLTQAIGETVVPAIASLASWVSEGLSNALAAPESMLNQLIGGITSVVGAITILVRNWDIAWEMIKTTATTRITNVGEVFSWLGGAAVAVASYVGENWKTLLFDAFEAITTALVNLGKNIRNFGSAVYEWIASGFKAPFEFKMIALGEGMADLKSPKLELPDLKLTDAGAALAPLLEELNKRGGEVAPDLAPKEADTAADTAAATRRPAQFLGLVEFARQLQVGALAADPSKTTAENTGKTVGLLQRILEKIAPGGENVAPSTAAD